MNEETKDLTTIPEESQTIGKITTPKKRRVNVFTNGGHHFTADIFTDLDDMKIFEDLLTGKQECIHIARMCFVRKNLTAVVLEDVPEFTQQRPESLPETFGDNGSLNQPDASEQHPDRCCETKLAEGSGETSV